MDERLIDLKNKVLDKALDKIFNMAQGYVDKVEEEDGCAGNCCGCSGCEDTEK